MVTVSTTTRTAQDLTAQARDVLGVSRLTNHALTSWLHGLPGVDQVGCEARAAALGTRSIKTTSKAWAIDTAIGMIDLTTLEGSDTVGKVRSLCAKALVPDPLDPTTPRPAAICVYGDMVATAKAALGDSGIHVAAVATAFPSGRASMPVKLADTRDAVEAGADEIDMVIDRGAFLSGDYLTVFNQIAEVKAGLRRPPTSRSSWRPASSSPTTTSAAPPTSRCSRAATSSRPPPARSSPRPPCPSPSSCSRPCATGATSPAVQVGVKPAGGIKTTKDAIKYLVMVSEIAGDDWLSPEWFRFGASSLLNDLLLQRQKLTTGAYSGADYVTID